MDGDYLLTRVEGSRVSRVDGGGGRRPFPGNVAACGVIWLAAFIVVGLFSEGSAAFIVSIPIAYYGARRLHASLGKVLWGSAILTVGIVIVLFLPVTRRALATYHLGQALKATEKGEVPKAMRHVTRAEQFAPNHPDVLYAHYLWAAAKGRDEDTVEFLGKAVAAGRDDIDTLYLLARLYAKSGRREEEIPLYLRILKRQPTHPEANYSLAMYYDTQLHDRARAIGHLRIARDSLPIGNIWRQRCEELLAQLGAR